jgi:hypothetical protein
MQQLSSVDQGCPRTSSAEDATETSLSAARSPRSTHGR